MAGIQIYYTGCCMHAINLSTPVKSTNDVIWIETAHRLQRMCTCVCTTDSELTFFSRRGVGFLLLLFLLLQRYAITWHIHKKHCHFYPSIFTILFSCNAANHHSFDACTNSLLKLILYNMSCSACHRNTSTVLFLSLSVSFFLLQYIFLSLWHSFNTNTPIATIKLMFYEILKHNEGCDWETMAHVWMNNNFCVTASLHLSRTIFCVLRAVDVF